MTEPAHPTRSLMSDRSALALLLFLVLLYFWPLVLSPTSALYSPWSDVWAQHIPAKRFLVRSFQETGEIPLWCSLQFSGSPFVHDPQVAIFYPPHWILLLMPEDTVAVALGWITLLHVLLAGGLTYLYGRTHQLSPVSALVFAVGYAFAGRWLAHLLGGGHYITIGLAWLPLVLLCLEKAIRARSVLPRHGAAGGLLMATLAGTVYALMVLSTQPQWTMYAGIFIALWTLVTAADATRRSVLSWLGYGCWTLIIAVGLAAVQLLPTLEAAGQSTRTIAGLAPEPLESSLQIWAIFIGPALHEHPNHFKWEDRGLQSLPWLLAAFCAPILVRARARGQCGVCLFLLILAGGGLALLSPLPGLKLFRQPSRMLIVAAFPMAYLAGLTTEAIFVRGISASQRRWCVRVSLTVAALTILAIVGAAVYIHYQGRPLAWHWYWATLPVTLVLFVLTLRSGRTSGRALVLWCLVLLVDLWMLTWSLVEVRRERDVYAPSRCVQTLIEKKEMCAQAPHERKECGRVWDVNTWHDERTWLGSPLGQGVPLGVLNGLESVRGYNPIDKYRYRRYLQLISESDNPLRALEGTYTHPVINDIPISNRMRPLVDLLNVRYVLAPQDWEPPGDGWTVIDRDPKPVAYNINLGGRHAFPPYVLYRNERTLPRAFVVPDARPAPAPDDVLETLRRTDFRKTVLIEGLPEDRDEEVTARSSAPIEETATIRLYEPNHVEIDVSASATGYLLLCDPWYPGWTCTIDGKKATIDRANFLFRGVRLPPGARTVRFDFEPRSYAVGRRISMGALLLVLFLTVSCGAVLIFSQGASKRAPTSNKSEP